MRKHPKHADKMKNMQKMMKNMNMHSMMHIMCLISVEAYVDYRVCMTLCYQPYLCAKKIILLQAQCGVYYGAYDDAYNDAHF